MTLIHHKTKSSSSNVRSRKIKAKWFTDFPWLKHDAEKGLLFCTKCIEAKCDNMFVRGKSDSYPKKNYFSKHEMGKDHRFATPSEGQRENMVNTIAM